MRNFLDSIETALRTAKVDCSGIGIEAGATELFAVRMAGTINNRRCERLSFRPDKKVAHRFLIDEIWAMKSTNGSGPWSDHMGGIVVDCTGLSREAAVKLIVERASHAFHQWFEV